MPGPKPGALPLGDIPLAEYIDHYTTNYDQKTICYNDSMKHNRLGFTIVELAVVIVIIAVLATITSIAYRTTQANARDKKRQTDVAMLQAAVEEYYADNGDYPAPTTCSSDPGGTTGECWGGQTWQLLKDRGYLNTIPVPDLRHSNASYNKLPDGNAYYGWARMSNSAYAIYVNLESGSCKLGKQVSLKNWGSTINECAF